MKKILITVIAFWGICSASAQWVVTDLTNLAQGIINSANQVYEGARTAEAMLENFEETRRIYEQGKEQLDAMKKVNSHIRQYRRIGQCAGIVGDIADMYITNYSKFLRDENFNPRELNAMGYAYNQILKESSETFAELEKVINTGTYVMSDSERWDKIELIHRELEEYRKTAYAFTRRSIGISMERAKNKKDVLSAIELYRSKSEKYW